MHDPAPKPRRGRPLLVAAVGVATVSYAVATGAGCLATTTSGNLLPPPPQDAGPDVPYVSGNLLPPDVGPPADDATAPGDAEADGQLPVSGNLLPPPADDSGTTP